MSREIRRGYSHEEQLQNPEIEIYIQPGEGFCALLLLRAPPGPVSPWSAAPARRPPTSCDGRPLPSAHSFREARTVIISWVPSLLWDRCVLPILSPAILSDVLSVEGVKLLRLREVT